MPASNFCRHLEATLDLGFVRGWVANRYADRGRPSIDPIVFFKLQLIMFFEGTRSERQLIETASLNLAHRWYLGYALDEALPDHSSLTRISTSSPPATAPSTPPAARRRDGKTASREVEENPSPATPSPRHPHSR